MDYTTGIQNKMLKVERLLNELNNEILIATKYLLQLKENSAAIVSNLNSITAPATYLQEFVNINSFLLKSISFLTEFNCKAEMLDMNEKSVLTSIHKISLVDTKISNESKDNLNSREELQSNVNKDILKQNEQLEIVASANENGEVKTIKSNSASVLKQPENHSNNTHMSNGFNGNSISSKKCKNANISIKSNSNRKVIKGNQKSNVQPKFKKCVNAKKNKSEVAKSKIVVEEMKEDQNKKLSNSSTPLETTKVKDYWYDSEYSEDFNCTENSEEWKGSPQLVENEDEDEIKPAQLDRKVGEEYNVVIEYIKSPSEFYVSIKDRYSDLLAELEKKLKVIPPKKHNSCNNKNEAIKAALSKEIGNYGLVYSKCDEIWCRVKITNWCLNFDDHYVNVFLLDYGESKCVSVYDLQAMPKYLKQYPQFTVQCHLHDVFPIDMEKNCDTIPWDRESSELMKSLTEDSGKIRMKVAPDDSFHSVTSLPVTLWLVDQDNQCVNELLVSCKHAIHGSVFENSTKKTEITDNCTVVNNDLDSWNPMKEDYESYKNSYDLDINDPAAIIYGYVGKDYDRICKHFISSGYCFKGDACRKEHTKLDHLGFTTDQEEVYQSAINKLVLPPPKSKFNIQVTCLLECNKFFCFMEGHNSTYDEEDLQSLLMLMNKEENILEMKKLLIPPSTGQIVIARFSEDEAWYRARVLECQPEKDQYTIMFVDYGNKETLSLSEIRAMEGRYLHLPFQAIECAIFGVEPNPKVPMKDIMDFMKWRLNDGHLTVEIITRLPGENISLLVNVFDQKGINIGKDLITKNYAIFKDDMIVSSTSASMPG